VIFAVAANMFMLALCLWREDRSGGAAGMTAVASVIRNRVLRDRTSYYYEVVRRLQFSSITAQGDPELVLWPVESDTSWIAAQGIASATISGVTADTTGGATLYHTVAMGFPKTWNPAKCVQTCTIQNQVYYREI
jgi:hypothetical protein